MRDKFNLLLIPLNAIWLFASGNIFLYWLLTTGAKRTEESLQAKAMTGIDYHLIIPASLLAIFGFSFRKIPRFTTYNQSAFLFPHNKPVNVCFHSSGHMTG